MAPPESWSDRKPTDTEVKAAATLQAAVKGHLARRILNASKPGKPSEPFYWIWDSNVDCFIFTGGCYSLPPLCVCVCLFAHVIQAQRRTSVHRRSFRTCGLRLNQTQKNTLLCCYGNLKNKYTAITVLTLLRPLSILTPPSHPTTFLKAQTLKSLRPEQNAGTRQSSIHHVQQAAAEICCLWTDG